MRYETTARDFYYETSASTLSYYITVDGVPIYQGVAVKSPNEPNLRINVGRRVSDYLHTSMPDFREYDGVVVPHPKQMRYFTIYDGEGNQLEEYVALLEYTGEWSEDYGDLSDLIDGKADPRQKIFWSTAEALGTSGNTYPSNTGGGDYKEIVDDGGGDDDTGITMGDYLSFTNFSGVGVDEGVIIYCYPFPNHFWVYQIDYDKLEFYYSYGHNWVRIPKDMLGYSVNPKSVKFKVKSGETIYFKSNLIDNGTFGDIYFGTFGVEGSTKFSVQGNVASLTHLDDFSGVTETTVLCFGFYRLFADCKHIYDASNLILPYTTIRSEDVFGEMFKGCSNLVTAPALPCTVATQMNAYKGMFMNCVSLTTPPDIMLQNLPQQCCIDMFNGCTSLNYIKIYATSTSDQEGTLRACRTWLKGTSQTGTFYCPIGVNIVTPEQPMPSGFFYYTGSWGTSGKPDGWTRDRV